MSNIKHLGFYRYDPKCVLSSDYWESIAHTFLIDANDAWDSKAGRFIIKKNIKGKLQHNEYDNGGNKMYLLIKD